MGAVRFCIFLAALVLFSSSIGFGADFYITQNTSGGDTGADCADAHSAAWFNTGSNWHNPKTDGKVGPGDTVHLCGTFTFPANGNPNNAADLLVIPGYGSVGSPITILFETGAIVQAPALSTNGGILCHYYHGCQGYIVIDGGTNGLVQATDNGSASLNFAYHIDGNGVVVCSGTAIRSRM